MTGTPKRNLDICMKCKCLQLRALGGECGPFEKELPLDEPSYGDGRYFRCILDNQAYIHLEAHLLENDLKAKWKYEHRELNSRCSMYIEQQMWLWNNNDEKH